jgi:hypothetical protein
MRTLAKTAVALGFIGATVIGTTAAVQAQGFYFGFGYPHSYYRDYDDYRYGAPHYYGYGPRYYGYRSPCRPGWSVQGGVCKPYRFGPWDYR